MQSYGWYLRYFVEIVFKALNFELKCPLKKSSTIRIQPINLRSFAATTRLAAINERKRTSVLISAGSPAVPICSANVYYMRIDKDFDQM